MISVKAIKHTCGEKHRHGKERSPPTSPRLMPRAKTPFCAQPPAVQPEMPSYSYSQHQHTSVCKPRCCLAAKSNATRKGERPRSILQLKSLTSTEMQTLTNPDKKPQRPTGYSDSRRHEYLLQKNFEEIKRCRYIRRKESSQDMQSPKPISKPRKPITFGKVKQK